MNIFEAISKGLEPSPVVEKESFDPRKGWTLEDWKKAGYPTASYHHPELIVTDIFGNKHKGIDLFPNQKAYAKSMGPPINLTELKKRRFK